MPDDVESVMKAIQKSINLYLCMSKPSEDNEIEEQPITAMAAVLLFNQRENFLYDVEMQYRSIFQKNDPGGYRREQNTARDVFGNEKANLAISDKEKKSKRRLRHSVIFRIIDETRQISRFEDDFSCLSGLAKFLPEISWSGMVCAMICELANQKIDRRKNDFEERTRLYAQTNAPNAVGLRHFYLDPTLSTSGNWKWAIGACMVDFRGTPH